MKNIAITSALLALFASTAHASDTLSLDNAASPKIGIDYKVWFQDHETGGSRYVSAQNNIIEITGYTQDGFIPNVSAEFSKAESNLYAFTQTDLSAFYYYDVAGIRFDYGAGVSARYDARNGKEGEATTLDWESITPKLNIGASYDIQALDGLTIFTGFEKRFDGDNTGFSGGTTTELGARYTFVDKGSRSITAELGYRRDIQDKQFSVTKVVETPEEKTEGDTGTGGSTETITSNENRRMISDGFYLGVSIKF